MREIGERYLRKIYYNLKTCALWLFMAGLTGVGVGAFSSAFSFCLKKSNHASGRVSIFIIFFTRWRNCNRIVVSPLWSETG